MTRDVFSEASRIEIHNCYLPSLTLTRCACMTKQLMAQETCAGTQDWEFVQARLRRLLHLRSASAQDPHEIEGLPFVRRRSACCSQPEGHHGTDNAHT